MYVLPPVVDGFVVFAKKNEEKMEKYAITWQHNYHRASIHLAACMVYTIFKIEP